MTEEEDERIPNKCFIGAKIQLWFFDGPDHVQTRTGRLLKLSNNYIVIENKGCTEILSFNQIIRICITDEV